MSRPAVDARHSYSVLSRIQSLLSPSRQNDSALSHDEDLDTIPDSFPTSPGQGSKSNSKFLKIRVVTWNMHDSLPKGNLEDLFGKIPYYDASSAKPGQFPILSNDESHPFHLVVVAGQECPTPSGIPMGLGAGFKIGEKDREKLKNGVLEDKTEVETNERELPDAPSGWTQLVEDWLCNGFGSKSCYPSAVQFGTPGSLSRRQSRKGPYQLLVKDRLMGIYLALYIHRDLKPLVQGISKSSVTAGLIGGRIGNKGGVGISLRFDGTTFLFLNAHLAAHEGKVNNRLANMSKIKAELEVDTFLADDDERIIAEDITDKFDFTFLFGDLNFRLNISRLHADWLISRQEYAQALEFDQLKPNLKKGAFFDGFWEAPIDFPPTFKYDVSRTSKRRKRFNPTEPTQITDIVDNEVDEATDIISLASSMTTVNSGSKEHDFCTLPPNSTSSLPNGKKLIKSRPKWLSLLSPSFPTSPRFPKFDALDQSPVPSTPATPSILTPRTPSFPRTSQSIKERFLRPPPLTPSASKSTIQDINIEDERGIYDTSSKKRVPSWCDRILWKTTIPKSLISEEELDDYIPSGRRSTRRVSQFFHSFRSPTSRHISQEGGPMLDPPSRQGTTPIINADTNSMIFGEPNSFKPQNSKQESISFSPLPIAPTPTSKRHSATIIEQPRSASGSIWRFLPSFLSPVSAGRLVYPTYSRGDVVCLSYGTLNDDEMKRLRGRSDHRPVIGAYAAYL